MSAQTFGIPGLTSEQVLKSRLAHGRNQFNFKKENRFIDVLKRIVKEPMVILLILASVIYFLTGVPADGFFLLSAVILVSLISIYQDSKSRNALDKLKSITQPASKVIRDGITIEVQIEDLVVGDSMLAEEGTSIAADGVIVHSNDFSVNESMLTGESLAIFKDLSTTDNHVYSGTTVVSGLAIATVTAIGNQTKLGQIGKSIEGIKDEKTPLEIQIASFVKKMVIVGAIVFLFVWGLNFFKNHDIIISLLFALTLAMSILPEEIPVAFTTFMALGAWRLMKMGIVVKQMKTVETLGSATVICTDKTGTLTENKMSLAKVFSLQNQKISMPDAPLTDDEKHLIEIAMWASEPIPFDPMELALHECYKNINTLDLRPQYNLIHEYPLEGKPPMMTHVFENQEGSRIVAAKGAAEALMAVSKLSEIEITQIKKIITTLAKDGYRLLAVGESQIENKEFPALQQDIKFQFKGIVAFYDPPKKNIKDVLAHFYNAGIAVKIITGDNSETTSAIAKQIAFRGSESSISGDELMQMDINELQLCVMRTNIFTRMFPEAKLKIVEALKANGQIVAMTGDGVNDAPALKSAHIGIAMGKKGTEIAKQAASLILVSDDLSKMVDAIAMGRRIYTNLKKAIQYIISIHIPIILIVFLPLALGWVYPNIFSPIHVIFLELIMGPTCSIIYENEPMEKNTMAIPPKPITNTFFNIKELSSSIIQGLIIAAGTLFAYHYSVRNGWSEELTRTIVFTVLIAANIFLTLVNRSFYYSVFMTFRYKNNLVPIIIAVTISAVALILYVQPVTEIFQFEKLDWSQLSIAILIGFISVIWFEFVKLFKTPKKIVKLQSA